MADEEHFRKLERMYVSSPCYEYFTPTLTVSRGSAEVVIPIKESFFHSGGATIGAVYFKGLDDSAFFAVNSLVEDVLVLTIGFNIYLTRPISEGRMKALGKVVHRSKNLFIAESSLVDSDGREIARGSGSFVKGKVKLSSIANYK
ncbi:MAG: PaaI family thioesterase [Desulfobacterales bacterium]|nr:PaaI family thioesterase [Desulfobacterales bacterium]